ncbi:MAG: hypothetical protein LC131_06495 [Anaerolineae bacterium]|nr:hypothetical protein [Anaerolineae bacterium]
MLQNFYPGTTKQFMVAITLNGTAPNIMTDTVTFTMKRIPSTDDAQAAIINTADVSGGGAEGKAVFTLSPADTAIAPGFYHYDIVWRRVGGDEYVLIRNVVKVLDRVSDV